MYLVLETETFFGTKVWPFLFQNAQEIFTKTFCMVYNNVLGHKKKVNIMDQVLC